MLIDGIQWEMKDTSFQKMGATMCENNGRLIGMFDELSSFLSKIKTHDSELRGQEEAAVRDE